MPIVGSFAGASARAYGASAGGVLIGDFESIQTITAGSAVASIEFTSIPSTYSHLQIRGILRASAGSQDEMLVQFNSDTGTNYSTHQFYGDGGSAGSGNAVTTTSMYGLYTTGASAAANIFGGVVIDILDYSNTNKFKTLRSIGGHDANGSGYALMRSGNWRSTSAVTSIKFFCAANIAQNSSLALYGIKA